MQEIGYPNDRRAKKSNRMEGIPRYYQKPESSMERGIRRGEPPFLCPEHAVIRGGRRGGILLPPLFPPTIQYPASAFH